MVFFRTPLTDLFSQIGIGLHGRRCRNFEMNMMECLEAYGYRRGTQVCKDEIDDYNECSYSTKQMKRVQAMRDERKKQWFRNERSAREYHAPPPKIDGFDDVY